MGFLVRGMIGGTYNNKYIRKSRPGKPYGRSCKPGMVWRVRRGNGLLGSIFKKLYQDRFAGVVPVSINNPEGQPYREKLKAAVLSWQNLSAEIRMTWHKKSVGKKGLTGYTLFIRDFMLS